MAKISPLKIDEGKILNTTEELKTWLETTQQEDKILYSPKQKAEYVQKRLKLYQDIKDTPGLAITDFLTTEELKKEHSSLQQFEQAASIAQKKDILETIDLEEALPLIDPEEARINKSVEIIKVTNSDNSTPEYAAAIKFLIDLPIDKLESIHNTQIEYNKSTARKMDDPFSNKSFNDLLTKNLKKTEAETKKYKARIQKFTSSISDKATKALGKKTFMYESFNPIEMLVAIEVAIRHGSTDMSGVKLLPATQVVFGEKDFVRYKRLTDAITDLRVTPFDIANRMAITAGNGNKFGYLDLFAYKMSETINDATSPEVCKATLENIKLHAVIIGYTELANMLENIPPVDKAEELKDLAEEIKEQLKSGEAIYEGVYDASKMFEEPSNEVGVNPLHVPFFQEQAEAAKRIQAAFSRYKSGKNKDQNDETIGPAKNSDDEPEVTSDEEEGQEDKISIDFFLSTQEEEEGEEYANSQPLEVEQKKGMDDSEIDSEDEEDSASKRNDKKIPQPQVENSDPDIEDEKLLDAAMEEHGIPKNDDNFKQTLKNFMDAAAGKNSADITTFTYCLNIIQQRAPQLINHQNSNGDTALMLAAKNSKIKIVESLLSNNAGTTITNKQGENTMDLVSTAKKNDKIKSQKLHEKQNSIKTNANPDNQSPQENNTSVKDRADAINKTNPKPLKQPQSSSSTGTANLELSRGKVLETTPLKTQKKTMPTSSLSSSSTNGPGNTPK